MEERAVQPRSGGRRFLMGTRKDIVEDEGLRMKLSRKARYEKARMRWLEWSKKNLDVQRGLSVIQTSGIDDAESCGDSTCEFWFSRTLCGICGVKESDRRQHDLDHDHQTGFVRGYLCRSCNIAEGKHPWCEYPPDCATCQWRLVPAVCFLGFTVTYHPSWPDGNGPEWDLLWRKWKPRMTNHDPA